MTEAAGTRQPHDALFQETIGIAGALPALLEAALEPGVAALILPDGLERVSERLVDPASGQAFADVLLRARLRDGGSLLLHIIVEHASTPAAALLVRLGLYQMLVYRRALQAEGLPLAPVVTLLVCNGRQVHAGPAVFGALIAAPEALRPWLMAFRVMVYDVQAIADADLPAHPHLRAGLMALKYARRPEDQVARLGDLLAALDGAPLLRRALLFYILRTFRRVSRAELEERMSLYRVKWEEIDWSTLSEAALAYLEEGVEKGLEKGLEKGEAQALRAVVRTFAQARWRHLPEGFEERLARTDLATLRQVVDALATEPGDAPFARLAG